MYLALFLAPWMIGYALSTIVMSHGWTAPAAFQLERQQTYEASFPPGTPPREIAEHILRDLDLDGSFSVQGPARDGTLTINRQDLVTPRRIRYNPADAQLTVERAEFHASTFLNRFHHRRGYQPPYVADKLFAVSVDAVIVAMVFWALSGLWMWWEMRATRGWGLACGLAGLGVCACLLWTL